MTKAFLWIAAIALAVFTVKHEFLASKTFTPFIEGCMAGEGATEARCECLSRYVHKHFSDLEVKAIMDQRMEGEFASKAIEIMQVGARNCANEE